MESKTEVGQDCLSNSTPQIDAVDISERERKFWGKRIPFQTAMLANFLLMTWFSHEKKQTAFYGFALCSALSCFALTLALRQYLMHRRP